MTLAELYQLIGGDYEQAMRVLRMDKLLDKHIRKLPGNGVVDSLIDAAQDMDTTKMFEAAHAMKGVCANLGLVKLSDAASEITEEFRPGGARKMTDEQVRAKVDAIAQQYQLTKDGIEQYIAG